MVSIRVGVNTAIFSRGTSGTASVTRLMMQTMGEQDLSVVVLAPPEHRRGSRVRNLLISMAWDLFQASRTESVDVVLSPCNVGLTRRGLPHVLVIQDTMPLDHPELFDRGFSLYARLLFGFSARHATIVVTASQHAAAGITRRWPSVSPEVLAWPTRAPVVAAARTEPPATPTVLMLGATEPHKQTVQGIGVVSRLRQQSGLPVRLQVIGPQGRAETAVAEAMSRLDPDGCWIERAEEPTDDGVRARLEQAWVLLQCSSDEGFCLPLLESACVALPAVHTGAGSMAEVHPYGAASPSSADLVERLLGLLDAETYRAASDAALEVARRHRPDQYAAALLDVIERAVTPGESHARRPPADSARRPRRPAE